MMLSSKILFAVVLMSMAVATVNSYTLRKHHSHLSFEKVYADLEKSCDLGDYKCPQQEFFNAKTGGWNITALRESPYMKVVRTFNLSQKEINFVLNTAFCCEHGECLEKCKVIAKEDPEWTYLENVLALGLPVLEKFRKPMEAYLHSQKNENERLSGRKPAVYDDFLDAVAEHRATIDYLLAKSKKRHHI